MSGHKQRSEGGEVVFLEWRRVLPGQLPPEGESVWALIPPSHWTLGQPEFARAERDGVRLRYCDRRLEDNRLCPRPVAWAFFPSVPSWSTKVGEAGR